MTKSNKEEHNKTGFVFILFFPKVCLFQIQESF